MTVAGTRDPSDDLAAFAANLRFEALPSQLIDTLKWVVLDTIGTTLAGGTLGSGCKELVAVARRAAGAPDATIWGYGDRVPALWAALVNGGMSHALNYDDVFRGSGHLGVVTIPAAFAIAEREGRINGRAFLVALAAGCEVVARLHLAVEGAVDGTSEARPQPTQYLGYFGAALTAANLLRLDYEATRSALGLALMQASGTRQVVLEGVPAKAIYAAFPNFGGVLAGDLARAGVGAASAVLEGAAGLFPTAYHGRYVRDHLLDGLGTRFDAAETGLKPWPTTARAHPYIEAGIDLHHQHEFAPSDIARVVVRGGPLIRAFCEPLALRRHPTNGVEVEDSIIFTVAKALTNGAVTLLDVQPAGLKDPLVSMLADRVDYAIETAPDGEAILEVALQDGRVLSKTVPIPLGSPSRPMPPRDILAKFEDCATHAPSPIAGASLARFVDAVRSLEELEDVCDLVRVLVRS